MSTDAERANRRRATGLTVTLGGLAILAAAGVVAWSWRNNLPDPVATHWGRGGTPDGFSPLSWAIAIPVGSGVVLVLAFGALTWAIGHSAANRRLGAAVTAWVSLFMSIILVGSLWAQRGLSDAHQAHGVNGVLLASFAGAAVAAVLAALAVPKDAREPTTHSVDADAPRARLGAGQLTTWTGHASSPAALAIAVTLTVLLLALAVFTQLWATLVLDVLAVGLVASMSSFDIRVDQTGVTIRSAIGLPRYRIPLDEVVRADVAEVSPVRDFGGWGWRIGRGGRVGIVLRRGAGLLIERTGGRSIVVTVDGAATAAGVINALADRARG